MADTISFYSQGISFSLKNKSKITKWTLSVVKQEKHKCDNINFIFCSDKYLVKLNKKYLRQNTLTDIITFDYSGVSIQSDIFISIDRVKENAKKFSVSFENELHRVMIHGVLHLCGYNDKSVSDTKRIRAKEDFYLSQFLKMDFFLSVFCVKFLFLNFLKSL